MIYLATFNIMILIRYALTRARSLSAQIYVPFLVFLFLFSAFRFEVGCDWSGYLNQYYNYAFLPYSEISGSREPLWIGLFKLQAFLGLPYPWINVFSSLIFFMGLHAMARRQPDPLAFLVLLFPILIINMPMSGIRQGTAIGVMFMAFIAFNDRALLRFILLTLIAASLHASALVFLLLAPLVKGGYSRNRLILAGLLAIPGSLLLMTGEAAEVATSRYVETEIDAAGAAFRVGLLVLTALYFFLFLRRKWARVFPEDFKLVMIGALMMMGMIVLLPVSTVIADRLAYYLIPIQAIIFSRITHLPWKKDRGVHGAFPYVMLLAVFVVWTSFSNHFNQCYLPYQTWLFGYPSSVLYTL